MPREEIISGDDLYDGPSGDAENIIGALAQLVRPRPGPAMARGRAAVSGPQFSRALIANQVGGANKESGLRAPLGFGFHTFTAAGTFAFIVEPQEAFRGERLMIDTARDGAAGVLGVVNTMTVGTMPQQPSTEFGIPFAMFSPQMTDAHMDWQICPAGTKIQINVELIGTFAEADSVVVACGLYGKWIRG
jgi:hypothetical protein